MNNNNNAGTDQSADQTTFAVLTAVSEKETRAGSSRWIRQIGQTIAFEAHRNLKKLLMMKGS